MKRWYLLLAVILGVVVGLAAGPRDKQKKGGPLTAAVTPHSAILNWTQATVPAGAPPVTSNKVYRGATAGTETLLAILPSPATTYTDSTVVAGSSYCFEVTAVNTSGEGPFSNEVCVSIPNPVAPNAPTGLTATAQ